MEINSLGVDHSTLDMSRHAMKQCKTKGFSGEQVKEALRQPYKVTDVRRYPGQKRYCGAGIAVVVNPDNKTIVTVYLDGVPTPLRPDQMSDPEARNSKRALR